MIYYMDSFKYTTLVVAITILVVALFVIGMSIRKSMKNTGWPPVISDCPDFWKFDDTTNECVNINDLGNADDIACPNYPTANYNTCERFDFSSHSKFSGANNKCEKQKWSDALGLKWDGITNKRNVCDDV